MKSAEDVEIEALKRANERIEGRQDRLDARMSLVETGIAWVVGGAAGMAALVALIKSGVLKMLVELSG